MSLKYDFWNALVAGGVAGLCVDMALFPIDTIKTRLQSERGFWKSGGFNAIYKGLGPVAAGSAPTAALFFCTYESIKHHMGLNFPQFKGSPYVHMFAASMAEIIACTIRVPVEIAKQRKQILRIGKNPVHSNNGFQILWDAYKTEGLRRGLYRGYGTTVLREIPFSFIQFPLWEYFKLQFSNWTGTEKLTSLSVSLCGALAGGISAGLTTPLDVAKTRIMLAERDYLPGGQRLNVQIVLTGIYREHGFKGLFMGFIPRVMWITIGGAIFFGFYDLTSRVLSGSRNKINS